MVPKNHTHLRQGFDGSSAGERNPPKHGRSVAERVPIWSYAFLHGQGRGLLRRRMKLRDDFTPLESPGIYVGDVTNRKHQLFVKAGSKPRVSNGVYYIGGT
jgi:hypothetical protein